MIFNNEKLNKIKTNKIKKVFEKVFLSNMEQLENHLFCSFFYITIDESGNVFLSPCINENYTINVAIFLNEMNKAGIQNILIAEPYYFDYNLKKIIHVTSEQSITYVEDLKIENFINIIPKENRVSFLNDRMSFNNRFLKKEQ